MGDPRSSGIGPEDGCGTDPDDKKMIPNANQSKFPQSLDFGRRNSGAIDNSAKMFQDIDELKMYQEMESGDEDEEDGDDYIMTSADGLPLQGGDDSEGLIQEDNASDDMSVSDGVVSDGEECASTSQMYPLDAPIDDFQDCEDLPQSLVHEFMNRINHANCSIPIEPGESFARLIECTTQIIQKVPQDTLNISEFLRFASLCFEKLLTDQSMSQWSLLTSKHVWYLCAMYVRLFALKLKVANASPTFIIPKDYIHIAYYVFSDKVLFHSFMAKMSFECIPVFFQRTDLENFVVYRVQDIRRQTFQWYKGLLYVFSMFDGFTELEKYVQAKVSYTFQDDSVSEHLLRVLRLAASLSVHLKPEAAGWMVELATKSLELMEGATDEDWKFKDTKTLNESNRLEMATHVRDILAFMHNKGAVSDDLVQRIDDVLLRFLLKMIQLAKLIGRTYAVEELFRLLRSTAHQMDSHARYDAMIKTSKTFGELVKWFHDNGVLAILLRDNLHISAYAERLENVLSVLLHNDVFRPEDLELTWGAMWGKHDVVQRNVLNALAKLSSSMTIPLMERLYSLVGESFKGTQVTRERILLLDFCRNLMPCQNDLPDALALNVKLFDLTWDLFHIKDVSIEAIELLLNVRVAILNSAINGDVLRKNCFYNCMSEIKQNTDRAVPLFTHLQQCVCDPKEFRKKQTTPKEMFTLIAKENTIHILIDSIAYYMERCREDVEVKGLALPLENVDICLIGSKFTHRFHVSTRLDALGFFISECAERKHYASVDDMQKLWKAIIQNPVSDYERQRGFGFFGANMSKFSESAMRTIFETCLLRFAPEHFTVNSFNEIASMLKYSVADHVSLRPGENGVGLVSYGPSPQNSTETTEAVNLSPLTTAEYIQKARNYLWKVILEAPDNVSHRATDFATCEMEDMSLPPRGNRSSETLIDECFDMLRKFEARMRKQPDEGEDPGENAELDLTINRAQRVVKTLKVLIVRYENNSPDRVYVPLYRASMGKCFTLQVHVHRAELPKLRPDTRIKLNVNSNWTLRHLYRTIYVQAYGGNESLRMDDVIRMDLFTFNPSSGLNPVEWQAKMSQMLTVLKVDQFPALNPGIQMDVLRLAGNAPMKKTLGELGIDETTIIAVRPANNGCQRSSFNVTGRSDSADSSGGEDSDDDLYTIPIVPDTNTQRFEMPPIVLAEDRPRAFYLLDFADLAHSLGKTALRDEIANLLDHLTLTDDLLLDIEQAVHDNNLSQYIVQPEYPTRTAFLFHVLHAIMTPVVQSEAFLPTQVQFLANNSIVQFFEFFTGSVLDQVAFYPSINARILLSLVKMTKFMSVAARKIKFAIKKAENPSSDDDDTYSTESENPYFNYFMLDVCHTAFKNADKAALFSTGESYGVPLDIVKALMFTAWTASRCSIASISCRHPPSLVTPHDDDEAMETCSTTSDSSFTSAYLEDILFAKLTDRHDILCETLTIEALDALVSSAQFCPEMASLFHVPGHLYSGKDVFLPSTSANPSFYEFILDGMLNATSDTVRTRIARLFFSLLTIYSWQRTRGNAGQAVINPAAGAPGPSSFVNQLTPSPIKLLDVMFANLGNAEANWIRAGQFFTCIFQLLDYCQREFIQPNGMIEKIGVVMHWLRATKEVTQESGLTYQQEELLVMYLKSLTHLLRLMSKQYRKSFGASGHNFLQDLFDEFLIPFSKAYRLLETEEQRCIMAGNLTINPEPTASFTQASRVFPVCRSDAAVAATFALILDIIRDVSMNVMQALDHMTLTYYREFKTPINSDLAPHYGIRDPTVFVGLKNAGATCYMNSVLQQLFMIEPFRQMMLSIDVGPIVPFDKNQASVDKKNGDRYARHLIHSVQSLFAHLLASEEQYYTPTEFWEVFQFCGREVNIREQQDAVEFFNSLADELDESCKKISEKPVFETIFGGTFADQKKCKDCPHMYEKETLFTSLAVDIRTHNNLNASLNEYVKGDVLEGDNAYYCEKCDKKVTAVKRLCIDKLPPFLMIQLKRFDMDWMRGSPLKFYDYFEFPSRLDMKPFTAKDVARREAIEAGVQVIDEEKTGNPVFSTIYRLRGVVVHSGEAHGGHYYSYIADNKEDGKQQWYRFDDTDVTAWDHNENEARVNWYGGYQDIPFTVEKDRRRFSAYMLVYESISTEVNPVIPILWTREQVEGGQATIIEVDEEEEEESGQNGVDPTVKMAENRPNGDEKNSSKANGNSEPAKKNAELQVGSKTPNQQQPPLCSPNLSTVDVRFESMSLHSRRSTTNRLPPYWERIVTKSNLKFTHERFQCTGAFFKFMDHMLRIAALHSVDPEIPESFEIAKRGCHVFACFLYTTALKCPNELNPLMTRDFLQTAEMYFTIPTVAPAFVEQYVIRSNVLQASLMQTSGYPEDVRRFFERIICSALRATIHALDNIDATQEEHIQASNILDKFIMKIVNVAKTHSIDFWQNPTNVIEVLIFMASESLSIARRLISHSALYSMLLLVSFREETRSKIFCRENPRIFVLLKVLFTSCSTVMPMGEDTRGGRALMNPFALRTTGELSIFIAPNNVIAWLQNALNTQRLCRLLVEICLDLSTACELATYLAYENMPFSLRLVGALQFSMDHCIKLSNALFRALIALNDSFQSERIRVACVGEGKIRGIIQEMAAYSQAGNLPRTLPMLLEFVHLYDQDAKMKDVLSGNETFASCVRTIVNFIGRVVSAESNLTNSRFPNRDYFELVRELHIRLQNIYLQLQVYDDNHRSTTATGTAAGGKSGRTMSATSETGSVGATLSASTSSLPRRSQSISGGSHFSSKCESSILLRLTEMTAHPMSATATSTPSATDLSGGGGGGRRAEKHHHPVDDSDNDNANESGNAKGGRQVVKSSFLTNNTDKIMKESNLVEDGEDDEDDVVEEEEEDDDDDDDDDDNGDDEDEGMVYEEIIVTPRAQSQPGILSVPAASPASLVPTTRTTPPRRGSTGKRDADDSSRRSNKSSSMSRSPPHKVAKRRHDDSAPPNIFPTVSDMHRRVPAPIHQVLRPVPLEISQDNSQKSEASSSWKSSDSKSLSPDVVMKKIPDFDTTDALSDVSSASEMNPKTDDSDTERRALSGSGSGRTSPVPMGDELPNNSFVIQPKPTYPPQLLNTTDFDTFRIHTPPNLGARAPPPPLGVSATDSNAVGGAARVGSNSFPPLAGHDDYHPAEPTHSVSLPEAGSDVVAKPVNGTPDSKPNGHSI